MSGIDYRLFYIILDKEKIGEAMCKDKNVFFNYTVYILLKDLLIDEITLRLCVTVDNRNVKLDSEKSLQEYLCVELLRRNLYKKDISVRYQDSIKNKNLQAVDLFVNAIYAKHNYNRDLPYKLFKDNVYKRIFFDSLDVKNEFE